MVDVHSHLSNTMGQSCRPLCLVFILCGLVPLVNDSRERASSEGTTILKKWNEHGLFEHQSLNHSGHLHSLKVAYEMLCPTEQAAWVTMFGRIKGPFDASLDERGARGCSELLVVPWQVDSPPAQFGQHS